jgi:type IV secretory pathway VirB9-like protein
MKRVAVLAIVAVLAGVPPAHAAPEARTVRYGPKDVITLRCKVRFTTLIVLPATEKILDYVIGDKDMWVLEGSDNFAYLKPAKADASTTVTLITQAGNIYSFLAEEGGGAPDIKVFVEPTDPSLFHAGEPGPRYVPAAEADQLRQSLEKVQAREAERLEAFAAEYPLKVTFDYQFDKGKKPFSVVAIWHDDRSTYVRSLATEKPTLYELKDGQATLINYDLKDNVYLIPKVVDLGQLAIGKKRMTFRRTGS